MFDANRHYRLLVLGRRVINCVGHFDSADNTSKSRESAVEMRALPNQNEEMSRGAVWFITASH